MNKNAKLSGQPIDTGDVINDTTNTPEPNGTPVTVTYEYGKLDGIYAKQIVQAGETAIEPDVPADKVISSRTGIWTTRSMASTPL